MPYIGRPPETGGFERQTLTANGSTTSFALNYTVSADAAILVSVGGVIQQPGSAYNLTGGGSSIAFTEAPASGVNCFVVFLGMAYDSPTFTGGSITGQTDLAAQPASDDYFLLYDTSGSGLKKVAYSNVQGEADDSVTNARLANMAANTVKVRDAATAGDPSDKAVGDTQILIGDGTGFTAAALSGDVTMANTGAVTITADSVEQSMIANNAVGLDELAGIARGKIIYGDASGNPAVLTVGSSGQALKSDGTDISWGAVGDALIGTAQEWSAQQNFNNTVLTFDATQDWALTANQVATLTLTANTTFDAPTQMVDGAFYSLIIIQDGTGSRTASWNTVFKWAAGTAPTLTTTASAKDIFVWRSDGTNMYEVGRQLNVS